MNRVELSAKVASESGKRTVDFSDSLLPGVTLSAPAVTAAVYSGVDASPSSILSGAATVSGSVVTQKFTAGVVGVLYETTWTVTTSDGQTLVKVGLLAVTPNE